MYAVNSYVSLFNIIINHNTNDGIEIAGIIVLYIFNNGTKINLNKYKKLRNTKDTMK